MARSAPSAVSFKSERIVGFAGARNPKGRLVTDNHLPFALSAALIGVFACAAAPVWGAIPGQPNATDVKTIDACLADAAGAKTDQDVCIGRVSSGCLENALTTAAREECNNREFLVWDSALNRDYAQLTALLTADNAKQALRDAERDFFVSKLKRCTFERLAHNDSPDARVAASRCEVKATARQDLWLIEQINSLKSH